MSPTRGISQKPGGAPAAGWRNSQAGRRSMRIRLAERSREASLAGRGASAVSAGAFLAALGGASGDPALISAGIGGLVLVAGSRALGARRPGGKAAEPASGAGLGLQAEEGPGSHSAREITSIAGETVELSLEAELPGGFRRVKSFGAEAPFEVAGHAETLVGYAIDIRAAPEFYGEYLLGEIQADSGSPLGLFSIRSRLAPAPWGDWAEGGAPDDAEAGGGAPLGAWIVRLKAYPRFYPAMLEALSLIGEWSDPGGASASLYWRRVGRGEEYAWSREYGPGDSTRFMDWKGTARRGRLMVKEFFESPAGRGAVVLFDGRAPGRRAADEMARDLLSVALGIAASGQGAAMVICQGDSHRAVRGSGEEVLRAALAAVFDSVSVADPEFFELFPPSVRSSLLRVARRRSGAGESGAGKEVAGRDGYADALRLVRGGCGDLVFIGCPLHNAAGSLRLISEAASIGAGVSAFLPTKPWLDAGSLEEAYEMRVSWGKILSTINSALGQAEKGDSRIHGTLIRETPAPAF